MDWDLIFDARFIKKMLYTAEEVNDWVFENTSYPFFLYDRKMYMTMKDGPGHTDYMLSKGKIIQPKNVATMISMAMHTGRFKCKVGKRKWNGYEVEIIQIDPKKDNINVVIKDSHGNHISNIFMSWPKRIKDEE